MASRLPLLCLLALACACARSTLKSSVADRHGGTDATAEMDFWDGLAAVPAVSNRDALRALLLSFGGADGAADHAAAVGAARARGWIKEDAELPANETARVGWIARAVCLQSGIRGGLTMRVLGASERYAVRELNDMRWLDGMTPGQAISGAQLIAVLSRAEDHIAGATGKRPKEDL